MPMIPTGGPQDPAGFGMEGPQQLGAGPYAGDEMMGGDPTDPSGEVQMGGMPGITPGGVAEAMQAAIEQRQSMFQEAAQMQLVSDLQEADAWIQQVMAAVGAEASTLDGAAGVPAGPLPGEPAGMPMGPDDGMGMGAAMMGEQPGAAQGGVTPEMLAAALGGGGMGL